MKETRKLNIKLEVPIFHKYIIPYGFLNQERESHALWFYYTCARATYESHVVNPIFIEGEKDSHHDFKQLFTSVAAMYEVNPEAMAKCWDLVDMQADSLHLPRLPNENRYRFDNKIFLN